MYAVLLPLVVGVVVRIYTSRVADKIFPWVKKTAGISTLILLVFTVVFHGRELLSALGSYAVGAQVIFTVGLAMAAYFIGFGLKQAQRSAMSLGVCSRNGGAMFVAITAFPNLDPRLMVMILLAVPVPVIVWYVLSRCFASRVVEPSDGDAA